MKPNVRNHGRTGYFDALVEWEPRIDVQEVTVTTDHTTPSLLQIDIRYLVRSTNTFYNLVFPFYLQEQRP